MKTILMLIAPQEFRDTEYIVPKAFFEQSGFAVKTASLQHKAIGRFGFSVESDSLVEDTNAEDFDGIFFVGGGGSLVYQDNPHAKVLAETVVKQNKPLGAICAAPRLLLAWGLLEGKRCTGFDKNGDFADLCKKHGATFTGKPTETDGNICTGSGPVAAEETALAFLRLFSKE